MPDPRYIPIQNGTVYDQNTGLMWKQCPEGAAGIGCTIGEPLPLTLEEAKRRARDWHFAGYVDWRLPTLDELRSLLVRRCYGVGIDSVTFPRTPAGHFWTSDPASYYPGSAWTLDFRLGHLGYGTPRDAFYVRLVRDAEACSPVYPATCLPHGERHLESLDGRTPTPGDGKRDSH
ncbi:MAG: Lcl C-terminal domain-containing protein [Thermochromatium sp.]